MHGINNNFLYAVSKVEVKFSNGTSEISSRGTGFFIRKDADLCFITNRHVLDPGFKQPEYKGYEIKSLNIDARYYNEASKTVETYTYDVGEFYPFYAENGIDDIVCSLMIKVRGNNDKTPGFIPYDMLATAEQIENELSVNDHVAFIGFPDAYDHKNNLPLLRGGIISSDPRVNYSHGNKDMGHVIAYEAFSTPGSSGSPVFATQKGFLVEEPLSAPKGFYRPVLLIGINAGCVKVGDVHQQISYMFKSDQIIALVDKAIEFKKSVGNTATE